MVTDQNEIQQYVDHKLEELQLSKQEACQRSAVPEPMLERFLEDIRLLDYGELLRVIIMFGSLLGSPEELAGVCGIDIPEENSD